MWIRSLGQEDPLEEGLTTLSSILPGESHGQRSLEGYRQQDCKESYTTEHAQEEGEVLAPSHDILLGKSHIYINLLASSLTY